MRKLYAELIHRNRPCAECRPSIPFRRNTTASRICTTSTWRATCRSTTSASIAKRAPSTAACVLEIGCGNGRILLPLLAAGLDAIGIDGSARRCSKRLRARPQRRQPAVARLPYGCSPPGVRRRLRRRAVPLLADHLHDAPKATPRAFSRNAGSVLSSTGVVVVDAFVPRPIAMSGEFVRDYARPFGDAYARPFEARDRAHAARSTGSSGVTRCAAPTATLREVIETSEDIRPFSPDELLATLNAGGFRARQTWWDYSARFGAREPALFHRDRGVATVLRIALLRKPSSSGNRRRCRPPAQARASGRIRCASWRRAPDAAALRPLVCAEAAGSWDSRPRRASPASAARS